MSAPHFTPRELELMQCLADGLPQKAIAAKFGCGSETVKRHVSNCCIKAGMNTSLELALYAISHRLVRFEFAVPEKQRENLNLH